MTRLPLPAIALALLALSGAAFAAPAHHPKPAPVSPPVAPSKPALSVYRWGAPKGPAQVDTFAAWLKRPDVWAEDFEASDQWGNVLGPTGWQLDPWSQWVKARLGRRLIFTVPMLVGAWDGSGPTTGPGAGQAVSLAKGAAGAYNDYYKTLAQNLVERGLTTSIIRLGHEFNGGWYTWRAKDDPAAYAAYWRQIVTTMRSVPGAKGLTFTWNPASGYLQFPAENAWPGDAYVDYVGLDIYDDSWLPGTYPFPAGAAETEIAARRTKVWNEVVLNGDHGLTFWRRFADQHHKPFAIPEWGVDKRGGTDEHGGLDDPQFITRMAQFIADPANHVAYHVYFDVNAGDGGHQLSPGTDGKEVSSFPLSAARFRALFGKSGGR